MLKFNNKTVLITGAASGIGKATALAFAQAGVNLALADIQTAMGEATAEEARAYGVKVQFTTLDVSQETAVEAWVKATQAAFGSIDIGINNAGIDGMAATSHEYETAMFRRVMDINVMGVWYCMKAQIPYMLAQASGSIVNVASVAGLKALHSAIAYNASKHAVLGMTKTAAIEYVKKGIRTNAVCPSFIETPMVTKSLVQNQPKISPEKLAQLNPTKRLGKPEEVASAILFLCSEEASYINGHAMLIDGGLSIL